MLPKKRSILTLALTLLLSSVAAVCADEQGSGSDKPTRVLEGGVKGTVILFDEGLAKISFARELIQESTTKIMKEATRKDTIVVRGPNAIGNGIVIPAIGGVGGVMQFGEMPIRRNKLDRFIADSEQNLAALQTYVDGLVLPPGQTEPLSSTYNSMHATMAEAQAHLQILKELASQKRLANVKIGREALKIFDAMAQIEKQKSTLLDTVTALNAPAITAPEGPPLQ